MPDNDSLVHPRHTRNGYSVLSLLRATMLDGKLQVDLSLTVSATKGCKSNFLPERLPNTTYLS